MATKAELVTLVPIKNMNRAIKFYTKTLGGRVTMRAPGAMRNFWASLSLAGSTVWLIAPEKREKRKLAYTTLAVTNIARFVKGLQGKGVRFQRATAMSKKTKIVGPIAYEDFGASAFFTDSEGNLWMVWQDSSAM